MSSQTQLELNTPMMISPNKLCNRWHRVVFGCRDKKNNRKVESKQHCEENYGI